MLARRLQLIVRRALVFFGAATIILCALSVLGGFAPNLAYVGVIGSSLLSQGGPWLIVVPLLGAVCIIVAASVRRSRSTVIFAAIGVLAALGAGVAVMQMAGAASAAGASIHLASALSLSTVFEPVPNHATEQYGSYGQAALNVTIYRPTAHSGNSVPVLVYVHGGGFVAGARTDHAQDMEWFAERGWLVISVDYPLSSEQRHLWDQARRYIACSLAWVAQNSQRYGADASRLSLIGESAGGSLVLNAAYMANQDNLPSSCEGTVPHVSAVCLLYPVVDLAGVYANPDPALGSFSRRLATSYTGGTPQEYPDRYAAVSPSTHISTMAPPTLIIVGASDHLVPPEGAYAFAASATEAGVEVRVVRFPFGEHGFDLLAGSIGNQLFRQSTYEFLKRHGQAP
jgi:acetyl esterase